MTDVRRGYHDKNHDPTPWRLLNRDGSFNIRREGCEHQTWRDAYHRLLRTTWPRFLALTAALYVWINALFGALYAACGAGALQGVSEGSFGERYAPSFFFSVHTFATIGYGNIYPSGFLPNVLVTIEALLGMLFLALATGLLFARFSRPTARVVFSRVALVQRHEGVASLVFRIANERLNQIAEAQITVTLSRNEITSEGERYRNFYELALERSRSPIFALSWTVVHPIDERSPLRGLSREDLDAVDAEIIVTLTGIDDTFSQTIHARFSYKPWEILWDRRFADMLRREEDQIAVNLSAIHDLEEQAPA